MNFAAYSDFLKKRAKDFRRIASRTKGEMTAEDLHGEALLVADHLSGKRGREIDWTDPADQSLIFGALTVEHLWGKNAERKRKVSTDEEREDHEGNAVALIDLLSAEETSDPLALLERREEEESEKARREQEDAILESYSQSIAYIVVLWHFDNVRTRAAAYLVIDRGTLRKRITFAAKILKVQPSLFDRIERIDGAFMPERGRGYVAKPREPAEATQFEWAF